MVLGNGNDIRFWKDNWTTGPLNLSYPDLFHLCRNKDASVSDIFNSDLQHFMRFCWARRLRIGEQQRLRNLVQQLPVISELQSTQDKPAWLRDRQYSSASMSKLLHANTSYRPSSFLLQRIWKEVLPPRIQFFGWLLARDRISSKATLVRRGILHHDLSSCSICSEVESSIHIVLHCHFAWQFWSTLLSRCNVSWVSPGSLDEFFTQWISLSDGRHRKLWKLFWFYGIWHLWKARNKRVFEDEPSDAISLVFWTVCKAVDFHRSHNRGFSYTSSDVFRSIELFYTSCTSLAHDLMNILRIMYIYRGTLKRFGVNRGSVPRSADVAPSGRRWSHLAAREFIP
ncbi:uncharacterized protein LOC126665705 [Mercurialis annua]|uniref:uncharacterized protein LOC126665705 n=1 Tax=Mercurialis annua TaxID=3986 RepID=UPI0021601B3B|nr:uncharacterized protein LOC126665705 [Mercurialis annua]